MKRHFVPFGQEPRRKEVSGQDLRDADLARRVQQFASMFSIGILEGGLGTRRSVFSTEFGLLFRKCESVGPSQRAQQ